MSGPTAQIAHALLLVCALAACTASSVPPEDTSGGDTLPGDLPQADVPPPYGPPSFAERGILEYRVIIHLHSAFSHDACDDEGLDEDGKPNQPCVDRLKAALCKEAIDVAFMTDHPSFMRDQLYEDLLYADEAGGDTLIMGESGAPRGVVFDCLGTDHRVFLVPGFEGTHTMPIGLQHHLADSDLYSTSFKTTTSFEDLLTLTEAVREAGGLVAIAHSEQSDIDALTIAEHDVSAMEIYNFHANFNEVLGNNIGDMILELEPYLGSSEDAIPADLAAFLMLGSYPEAALEKWQKVLATRRITAIAGSDVHENVLIPALCKDLDCSDLKEEYPNLVSFLEVGGPLLLSDGERIDSYERIFRWVTNHIRMKGDGDPTTEPQRAIEEGRNMVVFGLLGDASDMDFVAERPEGAGYAEIGDAAPVGTTLWVHPPTLPEGAQLAAKVFRIDGEGAHEVATSTVSGAWFEVGVLDAGPHYVEVWMTPLHLGAALKSSSSLAEQSYRWVVTNPIFVE